MSEIGRALIIPENSEVPHSRQPRSLQEQVRYDMECDMTWHASIVHDMTCDMKTNKLVEANRGFLSSCTNTASSQYVPVRGEYPTSLMRYESAKGTSDCNMLVVDGDWKKQFEYGPSSFLARVCGNSIIHLDSIRLKMLVPQH